MTHQHRRIANHTYDGKYERHLVHLEVAEKALNLKIRGVGLLHELFSPVLSFAELLNTLFGNLFDKLSDN